MQPIPNLDDKENKFKEKKLDIPSVGQPLMYKTAKELEIRIDEYFQVEDKPTLSGLAYYLGMSRKTLYNYKKRDEYVHIINKARNKVEDIYEQRLLYSDKPTGVIFALKNMNWTDRQQIETKIEAVVPIMQGTAKDTDLLEANNDAK